MIEDTSKHPIVSQLKVTTEARIGSYLGVPILLNDGSMYGTLCAVDPLPYQFKEDDLQLMKSFSKFIADALDLGIGYQQLFAQKEKLHDELELAKKVQSSVLTEPLKADDLEVKAYYKPSESLSGDLYSWFKISEHKYGIMIMDVMGHGVSASLITMSIRALLHDLITEIIEPIKVIESLNAHICRLFNKQTTFVTALYLVIDIEQKQVEYVNAGHPPGLCKTEQHEILHLSRGCLPLGVIQDIVVEKSSFTFKESLSLVLYTDGIVESADAPISKGIQTLEQHILQAQGNNLYQYLEDLYSKQEVRDDDICFITVEVIIDSRNK